MEASVTPAQTRIESAVAYAAFKRTRFFGSLDGLRAISILGVIFYHTVPLERGSLLGQGNKGVTLFFAISGFLIVTLLLRAKEVAGTVSLPQFWGRRALRIFPIYYAVLAAYGVLVWKFERDTGARAAFFANVPAFVSFTSNWFVDLANSRVIFYFAWSLAAEEQFYLVWPFVERFTRGAGALLVAAGALIGTQAAVLVTGSEIIRGHMLLKMATSVPAAILLGVILAHLLHRAGSFRWMWRVAGQRGSGLAACGLSLVALAATPHLGDASELIVALPLAFLVATCVIREDNDLAVLLRVRWIAWIGTVSYGMYLLHMIAVNIARRAGAAAGMQSVYYDFVAGTILALILASISYLTYERFFLGCKERWFGKEKGAQPRSATNTAAAGLVPAES